jgi:hypothetical protein
MVRLQGVQDLRKGARRRRSPRPHRRCRLRRMVGIRTVALMNSSLPKVTERLIVRRNRDLGADRSATASRVFSPSPELITTVSASGRARRRRAISR